MAPANPAAVATIPLVPRVAQSVTLQFTGVNLNPGYDQVMVTPDPYCEFATRQAANAQFCPPTECTNHRGGGVFSLVFSADPDTAIFKKVSIVWVSHHFFLPILRFPFSG